MLIDWDRRGGIENRRLENRREIQLRLNIDRLGPAEIPLTPTPLPWGEGELRRPRDEARGAEDEDENEEEDEEEAARSKRREGAHE